MVLCEGSRTLVLDCTKVIAHYLALGRQTRERTGMPAAKLAGGAEDPFDDSTVDAERSDNFNQSMVEFTEDRRH